MQRSAAHKPKTNQHKTMNLLARRPVITHPVKTGAHVRTHTHGHAATTGRDRSVEMKNYSRSLHFHQAAQNCHQIDVAERHHPPEKKKAKRHVVFVMRRGFLGEPRSRNAFSQMTRGGSGIGSAFAHVRATRRRPRSARGLCCYRLYLPGAGI